MRGTEAFTGESRPEFLLHVLPLCAVSAACGAGFAFVLAGFTLRLGIWPVAAALGILAVVGSLYSSYQRSGAVSGDAWQEGAYWAAVFVAFVVAAGSIVRRLGAGSV
jgi:hypothetical protein